MGETNLDKYNEAEEVLINELPDLTFEVALKRCKELWTLVPYNMDINPARLDREMEKHFGEHPDFETDDINWGLETNSYKRIFKINVGDISPEDAKAYIEELTKQFKK